MSNHSGNWLPYNLDGTAHECRDSKNNNNNEELMGSFDR